MGEHYLQARHDVDGLLVIVCVTCGSKPIAQRRVVSAHTFNDLLYTHMEFVKALAAAGKTVA